MENEERKEIERKEIKRNQWVRSESECKLFKEEDEATDSIMRCEDTKHEDFSYSCYSFKRSTLLEKQVALKRKCKLFKEEV
jgi:hypothetical protein